MNIDGVKRLVRVLIEMNSMQIYGWTFLIALILAILLP